MIIACASGVYAQVTQLLVGRCDLFYGQAKITFFESRLANVCHHAHALYLIVLIRQSISAHIQRHIRLRQLALEGEVCADVAVEFWHQILQLR